MRTVSGRTDRVVVVGAGLAGLSAALRLAGAGREVTVLEREDVPGGRSGLLELASPAGDGSYRFDTGPTVLTMPDLIADALDCVGERLEDWLELEPVDPLYRAYYPDGSTLDVKADPGAMADEVERVCGPREAQGYLRYVDFVSRLYRYEMRDFIDRNIDSPFDLLTPNLARLAAIGGFRRLAPKVGQYLEDPRTQRVLSFQSMYAGLSPYDALAIYAVIAYMDSVAGVFFPKGGMHAVPRALAGAADKHGVVLRYGTGVRRVLVEHGRAVGVETDDGERLPADVVVLNPDLPVAYRDLLPPEATPRRVKRLAYSPSCFLLLAGSTQAYSRVAHHNIHFGRSWRGVFDELIDRQQLMSDPSVLVTNPTCSDPSLAPPGREIYYVLFPTPNLSAGIDWGVVGPRYRDEVVARLEGLGYVGFGDAVEVEDVTTPADWARRGMEQGAPFAAAHSFLQTGPFRPSNLAPAVDGVVFAGSGTQPGVGVPMVLLSGRLAAERIVGKDRGYRSRALRLADGAAPSGPLLPRPSS
jgi:phytoene desaturase